MPVAPFLGLNVCVCTWAKHVLSSKHVPKPPWQKVVISLNVYGHPAYLTYMQIASCTMLGWNQDCWEK